VVEAERTVSWMAIRRHAPVLDADGNELGHAEAVLGDEGDDIFHGIALNLKGWGGHVELPANRVLRITSERIYTDLASDEAGTLPTRR
jgi:hypothetical protein